MVAYRLYCMDGLGKVGHVDALDAENDDEAVRLAYAMMLPVECEIWDGDRFVAALGAYREAEP